MLQRNIQIGEDLAIAHQGDQLIHMGIGVDVMQADPQPQLGQLFTQRLHMGLDRHAIVETGSVLEIRAIG